MKRKMIGSEGGIGGDHGVGLAGGVPGWYRYYTEVRDNTTFQRSSCGEFSAPHLLFGLLSARESVPTKSAYEVTLQEKISCSSSWANGNVLVGGSRRNTSRKRGERVQRVLPYGILITVFYRRTSHRLDTMESRWSLE